MYIRSVILFKQIVIVSPGTHLQKKVLTVKNHWVPVPLFITQLIQRQTPKLCFTACWNEDTPSVVKRNIKLKEIRVIKEKPQEQPHWKRIFYKNNVRSINNIDLCILQDAYHKLFLITSLGIFMHQGCWMQRKQNHC